MQSEGVARKKWLGNASTGISRSYCHIIGQAQLDNNKINQSIRHKVNRECCQLENIIVSQPIIIAIEFE